jgi:two-component system, OmpR family, phosphate regulon sensor histidine kinase PhoR
MRLEFISNLASFSLHPPKQIIDVVVFALYAFLLAFAIYQRRAELVFPSFRNVALFMGLAVAGFVFPLVARLSFSIDGWIWLSSSSAGANEIAIPLLATLPILAAAIWLGRAPAALIGFFSGFAYAYSVGLTWVQVLEGAMCGLLLSLLLRQNYRGALCGILRQPVIASVLVGVIVWPVPFYAYLMNSGLWSGSVSVESLLVIVLAGLTPSILAGSLLQIIFTVFPASRPPNEPTRTPPYHRTVAGRILSQLIPTVLVVAAVSLVVLNIVTLRIAFDRTLQQMERVASDTNVRLERFAQDGLSATEDLLAAGRFAELPTDQWPAILAATSAGEWPFQQVLLLDRNAQVIAVQAGAEAFSQTALAEAEVEALNQALASNRPAVGQVYRLVGNAPAISFVAPVVGPQSGEVRGALIGRIVLVQSVDIDVIVHAISDHAVADRGYLIDGQGHIILHSGDGLAGETWVANADPIRRFETEVGQAYEEQAGSGGARVVYWLRASQPDWHLVLERDRGSIMQLAVDMAGPLLITLVGLFILLTCSIVVIVQLQLISLRGISAAASRIADGELDTPVPAHSDRDDEIGRLARAIQKMAAGLGAGGEDLARLVEVSQHVSSRANLTQTLQMILRGITGGMQGLSAGMHHFNENGVIWSQTREGKADLPADVDLYLEHVSRQVWRNAREIVITNIESEKADMPRDLLLRAGIRCLLVLPIRREDRVMGTLWAAWGARRAFSALDMNYMAALANLAGIMTANNQIYRAVESERSRLATILNSTRDGILVTDAKGQLQLVNPAAEELLDLDLEKVYLKPLPAIISDENLFRMLADITRHGRSTATTELQRNGQRLYVSASTIQLNDRQAPQGWVLVMRDITDIKRLDDMKSDFLETVAHDMKSPLSYASGYAGLLMDESLNKTQLEYVEKIRKGIDTLTQLINELSELGKISNRVNITMSPCQLVHIAQEVAETCRPFVEDKGLTFHVELSAEMPMVIGDARWLKRAISNLVDNAIKYTLPPGWIKLSVQEYASSVSVSVADSGIGISPANRRRIFEKFYRVRHRDTLHIQGTGLGLSMVKTIAEQHGGQVAVESELGAGSVFYLTIPKERAIADLLDDDSFFSEKPSGADSAGDRGKASSSRYGADSTYSSDATGEHR